MKRALTFIAVCCFAIAARAAVPPGMPVTLQTRHARIQIDRKGFIISIVDRRSGKEYSPAGHPSPLLSLHESKRPHDQLVFPRSADFLAGKGQIQLQYPNGATAIVKVAARAAYFRLQLVSLTPHDKADNIVWGPLHTTIRGKIGDIIGVVRSDDWAIGMWGLDDNTIAGPPCESDCYEMGYYIHSPDPVNAPVPRPYEEGQRFSVGGNGISDTAFYSHPEEYFQQRFGTGAALEPRFGSSVAYHARDRRRPYTYFWSLLPGFQRSRRRHMVSDPLKGVDFINSGVALYACPDDQGLATIEQILIGEGLPHLTINGKWIRDPTTFGVTLNWSGPHDRCIEYAEALGVRDISRETREFYPCLGNDWSAGKVEFVTRPPMSFKAFTAEANRHGLSHGGLHTLCAFLQGGISNDVTPVPSEHLQAICRTRLARSISPTDTEIVVTDPSFLAEKGTWPQGDTSNYLRVDGEMLRYEGISQAAPWTLRGVKRGHASKARAHRAGAELVKLQQNCYNGFVPDIQRLPDYADYYADLMYRNGLEAIGLDGFESTVYQNQGYYGTRIFCRRLFETYARLTGGKIPRVTASCVFAGSWSYLNACNVGGGSHMFDPVTGRRGIEGKDIGTGVSNSYYPATFGIQAWRSDWSLYDAENLQAKAVGWDATYALTASQEAIDRTGEKEAILKAFHAWQEARALGAFTGEQKQVLRDPEYKFHLVRCGSMDFRLHPVRETRVAGQTDHIPTPVVITNPYARQDLQFSLQVTGSATGFVITLPNGNRIRSDQRITNGQFIICRGGHAYLADPFRSKLAALPLARRAILPEGKSRIRVQFDPTGESASIHYDLTVWSIGEAEPVGR